MGGKKPFALADEKDWLLERFAAKPDLTVRELLAELHDRGVTVSYFALWHIIRRAGLGLKKTFHASEQDRPDIARRRR